LNGPIGKIGETSILAARKQTAIGGKHRRGNEKKTQSRTQGRQFKAPDRLSGDKKNQRDKDFPPQFRANRKELIFKTGLIALRDPHFLCQPIHAANPKGRANPARATCGSFG